VRRTSGPGFGASLAIAIGGAWIGIACNAITVSGRDEGDPGVAKGAIGPAACTCEPPSSAATSVGVSQGDACAPEAEP
jgi:hypothetical protein